MSEEGKAVANYFRTGDSRYIRGLDPDVFETMQRIERETGFIPGRRPKRDYKKITIIGNEDFSGFVKPENAPDLEYRFIDVLKDVEYGSFSVQSVDDIVLSSGGNRYSGNDIPPRQAGGRLRPYDFQPDPSGYVARMENATGDDMRLWLFRPYNIDFADYESFSADVMLSSETDPTLDYAGVALDFYTTIPEQPPGRSWYCMIYLHYYNSNVTLNAKVHNVNIPENNWRATLAGGAFDEWYNLKMDIITSEQDPSLQNNQLRVEYYVNGEKMAETIPLDSGILLDPSRLGFGPKRSFSAMKTGNDGSTVVKIDNVRARYTR